MRVMFMRIQVDGLVLPAMHPQVDLAIPLQGHPRCPYISIHGALEDARAHDLAAMLNFRQA